MDDDDDDDDDNDLLYTEWSQRLCAPDDYSTVQLMIWRWLSQTTFGMCTVLYWTQSSRTHFGVSINVCRLAGDTLNITCNFRYCNHQEHRDFLITLYIYIYICVCVCVCVYIYIYIHIYMGLVLLGTSQPLHLKMETERVPETMHLKVIHVLTLIKNSHNKTKKFTNVTIIYWGTLGRSWLRHCATNRKVAGSIPDGVIGLFHWHNPSGRTMALGLTQPPTEMSTRNISRGVKAVGA